MKANLKIIYVSNLVIMATHPSSYQLYLLAFGLQLPCPPPFFG